MIQRNGREHTILFDDADRDVVMAHTWCVTSRRAELFYATTASRRPDGRPTTLCMHRLLMGVPEVDHINHNGLDNRRSNLRPSTKMQNQGNSRPRSGGTSSYKGVSWHRRGRKWMALITVNQRHIYLGLFVSEIDAAAAYDAAARAAFGEYALPNFPEPLVA